MLTNTAQDYKAQLPKRPRFQLGILFAVLAGLASIFGAFYPFLSEENQPSLVSVYLIVMNVLLWVFILILFFHKERRYSQSVFFTHFVNHVIRDCLANARVQKLSKDTLTELLNAIAECLSILTGVRCRASLKELHSDLTISTVARNSTSDPTPGLDSSGPHALADNTDFYTLWYALEGRTRYYLCNDLLAAWSNRLYKNSSLAYSGKVLEPHKYLGWLLLSREWPLPYRSTLVLPIRYISDFSPPVEGQTMLPKHWDFWGFLCIDSNSRNVFNARYLPELGATFADAFYILFNQLKDRSKAHGKKVKKGKRRRKEAGASNHRS